MEQQKTYNELIWETFQKLLKYLKEEKPDLEQKIRQEVKDIWYLLTGIQNFLMPHFIIRMKTDMEYSTFIEVCELDEQGLKEMGRKNFGINDQDFLQITEPQKNRILTYCTFMCKTYHRIQK